MLKSKLLKNHRTRTFQFQSSSQQLANLATDPMKGNGTPIHVNQEGTKQLMNHDQSDQWARLSPARDGRDKDTCITNQQTEQRDQLRLPSNNMMMIDCDQFRNFCHYQKTSHVLDDPTLKTFRCLQNFINHHPHLHCNKYKVVRYSHSYLISKPKCSHQSELA